MALSVALLFGGKSGEHEISLLSARSIFDALDPSKYRPILVGISKSGTWHLCDANSAAHTTGPLVVAQDGTSLAVRPGFGRDFLGGGDLACDVVFPVLHGTGGEDGAVQGLLDLADVPYVGSGVLGSAVGMDKEVAKRLLTAAGLPVVDWITVYGGATAPDVATITREIAEKIGYPCFVKPANQGSSVGVHKVKTEEAFSDALNDALSYDSKVIIERGHVAREIECAVLGNFAPEAATPGEVIVNADFYSYEAKYLDPNGAALAIPANLTASQRTEVSQLALAAYRALELSGMARVNFFLDKQSGRFYLNEVNTIPGFTAISMYPKMWEHAGVTYPQLVQRLIELAIDRHRVRGTLKTSWQAG